MQCNRQLPTDNRWPYIKAFSSVTMKFYEESILYVGNNNIREMPHSVVKRLLYFVRKLKMQMMAVRDSDGAAMA